MTQRKSIWSERKVAYGGAIASLIGIPLALVLWYTPRDPAESTRPAMSPPTSQTTSTTTVSTAGPNSPVHTGSGNIIVAPPEKPKPDFIANDDGGAGPLLMKEPDFEAFLASVTSGDKTKAIGRLINGTGVAKLDLTDSKVEDLSVPWAKVRVLEGDLKGSEGWVLMKCLREP